MNNTMSSSFVPSSLPSSPTLSAIFVDENDEESDPFSLPQNSFTNIQPLPHETHNSENVKKYMGYRTPLNTTKSNMTSLRCFASFLFKTYHKYVTNFVTQSITSLNRQQRFNQERERNIDFCHRLVFGTSSGEPFPLDYNEWNAEQLSRVRYYLSEFVINYKSDTNDSEINPSSMKAYLLGLQRCFRDNWGYKLKILEGPIFNCPKNGLMAIIDNKFSEQQARGLTVKSHNVLEKDDLNRLYDSHLLSKSFPSTFQSRLVFDIALLTAMRASALHELTLDSFSKTKCKGEEIWLIQEKIGSRTGACQTSHGGWNAVRDKAKQTPVFNRSYFNGKVNFFSDIDEYMTWCLSTNYTTNRFFLAVNIRALTFQRFFKNQNLGRNKLTQIIKDTCNALSIKGCGENNEVVLHSLRGTVATILLENGHADSSVALRTGHRDLRSLKNYQSLQGKLGEQQQDSLFNTSLSSSGKRSLNETTNDNKRACIQSEEVHGDGLRISGICSVNNGTININVNLPSVSKDV